MSHCTLNCMSWFLIILLNLCLCKALWAKWRILSYINKCYYYYYKLVSTYIKTCRTIWCIFVVQALFIPPMFVIIGLEWSSTKQNTKHVPLYWLSRCPHTPPMTLLIRVEWTAHITNGLYYSSWRFCTLHLCLYYIRLQLGGPLYTQTTKEYLLYIWSPGVYTFLITWAHKAGMVPEGT